MATSLDGSEHSKTSQVKSKITLPKSYIFERVMTLEDSFANLLFSARTVNPHKYLEPQLCKPAPNLLS